MAAGPKTPTDAIVLAMEKADEMTEMIVIYRIAEKGVGWISTIEGTGAKLGLIEEAKMGIFAHTYGLSQEE